MGREPPCGIPHTQIPRRRSLRHGSPRVDEQRGGYSSTLQSDAAHRAVFRSTIALPRRIHYTSDAMKHSLRDLLLGHEDWLIYRVIDYAKATD